MPKRATLPPLAFLCFVARRLRPLSLALSAPLLKPERFALTLLPCFYLVFLSFFNRRPERWVFVQTFYGAANGWQTRSHRTAADAERLVSWLNRVDSLRNHRVIEVSA